jgi:MFS family permease
MARSEPSLSLQSIAFVLGEPRDGILLLNLQSVFLVSVLGIGEENAGLLFLAFGLAQICSQPLMGRFIERTPLRDSTLLLGMAMLTTFLTLVTVFYQSMTIMLACKVLQGALMTVQPPAINMLTMEVSGSKRFSEQVSKNEKATHLGTLVINAMCGILAFSLLPLGCAELVFLLPIVALAPLYSKIRILETQLEEIAADVASVASTAPSSTMPPHAASSGDTVAPMDLPKQNSKLFQMLLFFFAFHLVNAVALPLAMQLVMFEEEGNEESQGAATSFLVSSFVIVVSQLSMSLVAAHVAGTEFYGRKPAFQFAIFVMMVRCAFLSIMAGLVETGRSSIFIKLLILSSAILDGVSVGVFNVVFVLITADVAGPGRLSSYLGYSSAFITAGATLSGFCGELSASSTSYSATFAIMAVIALLQFVGCWFFFSETNADRAGSFKEYLKSESMSNRGGSKNGGEVGEKKMKGKGGTPRKPSGYVPPGGGGVML